MADVMNVAKYIGFGILGVMFTLYIGQTVNDSLNDAAVTTIWNATKQFFVNFTSKLATAGNVLGVVLIIGLFGLVGIWGAKKAGYM